MLVFLQCFKHCWVDAMERCLIHSCWNFNCCSEGIWALSQKHVDQYNFITLSLSTHRWWRSHSLQSTWCYSGVGTLCSQIPQLLMTCCSELCLQRIVNSFFIASSMFLFCQTLNCAWFSRRVPRMPAAPHMIFFVICVAQDFMSQTLLDWSPDTLFDIES